MNLKIKIHEKPKYTVPGFISKDVVSRNKINGRNRKIIYKWLISEYGEKCAYCKKTPPEAGMTELDIEHVDGNGLRHFWKNLVPACHECNCRKNSKGWRRKEKEVDSVCVRVSVTEPGPPKPRSAEMERNQNAEVPFQEAFEVYMQDKVRVEYTEMFKDTWAMEFGVSQITINRYVGKITSESSKAKFWMNGNLDKKRSWIEWKPEHNPFKDQIEIFG